MKIRAYATLRDLLGWGRLEMALDGPSTVGEVLQRLTSQHPAFDAKLWDAQRKLTGFVTVLVNGRAVEYLAGLDTPIGDKDTLALFPPVGGG